MNEVLVEGGRHFWLFFCGFFVKCDSAKSVFDFESPCDAMVIRLLHLEGETVSLSDPTDTRHLVRDW